MDLLITSGAVGSLNFENLTTSLHISPMNFEKPTSLLY